MFFLHGSSASPSLCLPDDLNNTHQHCVLAGDTARFSSTHRVAEVRQNMSKWPNTGFNAYRMRILVLVSVRTAVKSVFVFEIRESLRTKKTETVTVKWQKITKIMSLSKMEFWWFQVIEKKMCKCKKTVQNSKYILS